MRSRSSTRSRSRSSNNMFRSSGLGFLPPSLQESVEWFLDFAARDGRAWVIESANAIVAQEDLMHPLTDMTSRFRSRSRSRSTSSNIMLRD